MIKLWKSIRGYKRQAGAIIAIVPIILQVAGLDDETSARILSIITMIGTTIWGIGTVDRTAVLVSKKFKKDIEKNDPVISAANEVLKQKVDIEWQ